MNDVKTVRRQLWVSLDMCYVRRAFVVLIVVSALAFAVNGSRLSPDRFVPVLVIAATPFILFLLYRTWKIFRRAESYIFQEAVLDHPTAGWGRGSIRFTVTVKDSDGHSQRAYTHGIFSTHSLFGPNLEDYVNRKVRVAYNEETGTLVVIA